MRIWIINQSAGKPFLGWGERHYYIAKEWVKQGHSVHIYSSKSSHLFFGEIADSLPKNENVDGINFTWFRTLGYQKSKSIARIIGWVQFMFMILGTVFTTPRNLWPEKIIVSSSPITPVLPALILKKVFKCELIFEIRDIWPLSLEELGSFSRTSVFIRSLGLIEKIAYRKSDKIVGVMKYGFRHISSVLNVSGLNNYYWIPNGYSIQGKCPSIELLNDVKSELFELKKFNKIIGYAGTLGIANNMEEVIRLAVGLKGIHIVIIGDGPEKANLESLSAKLKTSNVSFFPKVQKECLGDLIRFFDFGCISWKDLKTYTYGVSANKYFDYLFWGKPIIRIGNVKGDPVELHGCGLIVNSELSRKEKIELIQGYCFDNQTGNVKHLMRQTVHNYYMYDVLAIKYMEALLD